MNYCSACHSLKYQRYSRMAKDLELSEEEVMENYEEDITKYPTPDKQYDGAKKYETYESIQTGAMGKAAK